MRKLIPLLSSIVLLAGCGAEPTSPQAQRSRAQAPASGSCDSGAFASRLYGRLAHGDGSFAFSPYSIQSALAMAAAGARGETLAQLRRALGCTGRPSSAPFGSPGALVESANSLWGQDGTAFHQSFLDRLSRDFRAPLREVDFKQDAGGAVEAINSWVSRATHGKIDGVLGPGSIDQLTRLVLVNAVYLKADWLHEFEPDPRDRRIFHAPGGDHRVPFMSQHEVLGYLRRDGYQAIELPYVGERLAFDVLLPDAGRMADLERRLTGGRLNALLHGIDTQQVVFSLPKFDLASDFQLADALGELGVRDLFSATADLSGIADEPIYISRAIHRATVTVDESGTEAAAVTALVGRAGSALGGSEPPHVTVDRPFVFAIRDLKTGTVLFLGRVTDPKPA